MISVCLDAEHIRYLVIDTCRKLAVGVHLISFQHIQEMASSQDMAEGLVIHQTDLLLQQKINYIKINASKNMVSNFK